MRLFGEAPRRKLILLLAALACASHAFEADAKSMREGKCERSAEPSAEPTEIIKTSKSKLNLHAGKSSRKKAENCGKAASEAAAPKQPQGG
jgi:hypothetical protein